MNNRINQDIIIRGNNEISDITPLEFDSKGNIVPVIDIANIMHDSGFIIKAGNIAITKWK